MDYIHDNPVRKGLVWEATAWRFSSAAYWLLDPPGESDVILTAGRDAVKQAGSGGQRWGGTVWKTGHSRGDRLDTDDSLSPYQQNTTWSAAEESGDMFSNWSFNSFDNDDYGTGRYGWMSNNMDVYLPLAVAANQ